MICEVTRDHLGARRLSDQLEVLPRQLDRGVERLTSRGSQEDPVEVAGRQRREARGQLDRGFVGEGPYGEVAERLGLASGGLAEFGTTVAGLHGEQTGETVEVALAVLIPHIAALAAGNDRHLAVGERTEAGEVHPQVTLGLI